MGETRHYVLDIEDNEIGYRAGDKVYWADGSVDLLTVVREWNKEWGLRTRRILKHEMNAEQRKEAARAFKCWKEATRG